MEQGKVITCIVCSSTIVITMLTKEEIVSHNDALNKNYFTLCASICADCDIKILAEEVRVLTPKPDQDCIIGSSILSRCSAYIGFSAYCHKVCRILTYGDTVLAPVSHRLQVLSKEYKYVYDFVSYGDVYDLELCTVNSFTTSTTGYSHCMDCS